MWIVAEKQNLLSRADLSLDPTTNGGEGGFVSNTQVRVPQSTEGSSKQSVEKVGQTPSLVMPMQITHYMCVLLGENLCS